MPSTFNIFAMQWCARNCCVTLSESKKDSLSHSGTVHKKKKKKKKKKKELSYQEVQRDRVDDV